MNQNTLDLLNQAKSALFDAEQAISHEENDSVNAPLYRMRIGLSDVIERYKSGKPICDHVTAAEYMIHSYLKHTCPML